MSTDIQLASSGGSSGGSSEVAVREVRPVIPAGGVATVPARAPAPINPLKMVHQGLRGRYPIAVVLGVVFAGIGAAVAWKSVRPQFHSEALVRIASELPPILTNTDQNAQIQEQFMQSQRVLMQSRRIIGAALDDSAWKSAGRLPPDPQYIATRLRVDIRPRSEYIQISVTDEDPALAMAAVTSIVNAYASYYSSDERRREDYRFKVLDERRNECEDRIRLLEQEIQKTANEYGTSDLTLFFDSAYSRVARIEAALADIQVAMASAPSSSGGQNTTGKATAPGGKLSAEELEVIAVADPLMRSYVERKSQLEDQLNQLVKLRGLGPSHKDVLRVQEDLDSHVAKMNRYAKAYQTYHQATGQSLTDPRYVPVQSMGKSRDVLLQNEANLTKLRNESKKEMLTLGQKRLGIQQKQAEQASLRAEVANLTHRYETLKMEGSQGGRLTVLSTGEMPTLPDRDPRYKVATAAGAMGFCLPAAVIVLLGTLRRRYRYSDDTEGEIAPRASLLGILPKLPDGWKAEDEHVIHAAQCVHQIRITLRAQAAREGTCAYLVTSAAAGEGKTSVAMSLGLSYATAQLKTLVIDADWVGRSLTHKLKMDEQEGLYEALAAGSIRDYVRQTTAGLNVLPAGKGDAARACSISLNALRPLLLEARRDFDAVIIDSGPILGSVEASVVAQEVDGVIFTISRGQERMPVEQAVRRLNSLGTRIAGFVFNQAALQDFRRSAYGSVSRSSSGDSNKPSGTKEQKKGELSQFGPLVQAVVSQLPQEAGAQA